MKKFIYPVILIVALTLTYLALRLIFRSAPIPFPPNTTIVPAQGDYAYENKTNTFQTQFKSSATDTNSIVFENNLGEISFYTPAVQSFGDINSNTAPVADGSSLTYPAIFPGIDLKYTITSSRLLEEFIVQDAMVASQIVRIEQRAQTKSIYVENDDGSITFYNKDKEVFTLPHPLMYETSNPGVKSEGIVYEIKPDGDQLIITKVITEEGLAWLADPQRLYPIAIDLVIDNADSLTAVNTVIDNADTSSNWSSSDATNTTVSQETTIKQEGAGSVKVQTTAGGAFSATGGTITTSGDYTIHTFTGSGTFTPSGSGNVEVLVVAGGGGSCPMCGGGGAGGLLYNSSHAVTSGAITVTVGAGGAGGNTDLNTSGSNSIFSSMTAIGGGKGVPFHQTGTSGGSGSGGGFPKLGGGPPGAGTTGQGHNGGLGNTDDGNPAAWRAGGGGGADADGASGNISGNGGSGTAYSISGTSVIYAGGGGGGTYSATPGTGGSGGGGAGNTNGLVGVSGTSNLGGGGGGGGYGNPNGGAGGSGIVIIRYLTTLPTSFNDTVTRTVSATDLSAATSLTYWVRSSVAGSYATFGFGETAATEQTNTITIAQANTWEQKTWDISGIAAASKNAVTKYALTFTGDTSGASFYLDDIRSQDSSGIWTSSDAATTTVSQETTIKQEGAGSVKVQTTAGGAPVDVDLMEYSSDGAAQTGYVSNGTGLEATGGTITTSGDYTIHTFTSNGTFTPSGSGNVEALVVAGGGGGGGRHAGGGGGGGVIYNSNFAVGTSTASCKAILDAGASTGNGVYTIDPDGAGGNASFQAYCDMTTDSGGWTVLISHPVAPTTQNPLSDYGTVTANGAYSIWSKRTTINYSQILYKPTFNANMWATLNPTTKFFRYSDSNGTISSYTATSSDVGISVNYPSYSTGCSGCGPNGCYGLILREGPVNWCSMEGSGFGLSGGDNRGCHYDSWNWGWRNVVGGGNTCPTANPYQTGYALVGVREAYNVIVGSGGSAAPYGGRGGNGGNSIFSTITATGGGGGGGYSDGGATVNGNSGGSGGGGAYATGLPGGNGTYGTGNTPSTNPSQGNNGGVGSQAWNGGGAGGAGQIGGNASGNTGGKGGDGISSSISGTSTYYGGGGGGAGEGNVDLNGGAGGLGGGGRGTGAYYPTTGVAGTPNTGGGGGGSRDAAGTIGGSGVVIIRHLTQRLQSYSEATIKTQGTYALKGVANITTSLNKTLTRTIASPLNLSDKPNVTFDLRASRTGSNIKVGLHDSGGTTTEVTPNITQANTFQSATIDLSGVTNANKDAIDQIIITVVNADATNTFYIDNMLTTAPTSLNDTVTRTTFATDLSGASNITYWVRSSVAGSYATFGFGESAATEQTNTITINQANTWEQKSWDISGISSASRNAVTKFAFTFTGDTSGASFYFDDIQTNALSVPTLGTATSLSDTSIRWNFTDNSSEETGFKIYDSTGVTVLVTCASTNLTYCDETGLTPNTQYTRKIAAYNASATSIASGTVSGYTLAAVPAIPALSTRVATTININPDPASNSAGTQMAIYKETGTTCDGSGGSYIAANGSDNGATAVWQTDAQWSTVTATGLSGEQAYSFCIKARNGNNVETAFSPVGSYNAGFIPLGGNYICTQDTVSSNTLTNRYVDGTNAARYVIALDGGTGVTNNAVFEAKSCIMTLNSTDTLVVGSLELSGGSVAIATGGVIKIGQPVWAIDADADGYTSDTKLYYGSQPAGGVRKNTITTLATADCGDSQYATNNVCCTVATRYRDADADTYGNPSVSISACTTAGYVDNNTDCNDASASLYRSVAGYLDNDGDGYGAGAYTTCAGASGTYRASGADCYDGNASAYPGSGACSGGNRGDGSFDWNCDGGSSACGTTFNYASAGSVSVWSTLNDGDPDNNNGECSARNSACGAGSWAVYAPASIGCGQAGYAGCASTSTGTTGCCVDCGCAYPSISTVCTGPGGYGTQACQ